MAGVLGQPLWSVRLGVGSFITFDFGAKVEDHGRAVGAYHLWIYMCDWQMISKDRVIAHSELSRKVLEIAVRRFEGRALSKINISQNPAAAVFAFEGDLKLVCQAYEDAEADEELWMLFAPEGRIVSLAPQGILLEKESRSAARRAVNF
ncbi:MAG: hypothetical protein ABI383_14270 [Acidobacteriaceae bacterium]